MKSLKFISIVLLGIMLIECHKDNTKNTVASNDLVFKAPPPLDSCPNVPPSQSFDGYITTGKHPDCRRPCFNPNNGSQFVHLRDNQLYIFDTITKIDKPLLVIPGSFVNTTCVTWSSNGWIYFNHYPDGQIWKINSDGSGLIQVTKDALVKQGFALNKDGSKMIIGGSTTNYYVVLTDSKGIVLDTLNFKGSNFSWSPDDSKILYQGLDSSNNGTISYYDLKTKSIHQIIDLTLFGINDGLSGLCWLSDSRNIIACLPTNMLFRVDSKTGEVTPYRYTCVGRRYSTLGLSPDGKKIIACRSDFRVINYNSNTAYAEDNIWIMDYDGWNEHEIVIK